MSIGVTITPNGWVYNDDLETDTGWTVNPNSTDTATAGIWEIADPESTWLPNGEFQNGTAYSGSQTLVTGALAGSSAGDYDIEGGVTSVRSPDISLPVLGAGETLELSLRYYFAFNDSNNADYFKITLVGSSSSQILLQRQGNSATYGLGMWEEFAAVIDSFAGDTVYLLIEAADESGDSDIEAAVDDLQIAIVSASSGVNLNPPEALADAAATNLNIAVELNVLANDSDADNEPIEVIAVAQPSNGVAAYTQSTVIYSPNKDYTGTDNFAYTISDGHGGTATASVSVNVAAGAGARETVYLDVFETNLGWIVDPNAIDTATTGVWEIADPESTSLPNGEFQNGTAYSGSQALVTGALAGSSAGSYDIDGGVTSVRSPDINLPVLGAGETLELSLQYYFAFNNSNNADYFKITLVGSSSSQILLQRLGNGTTYGLGVWEEFTAAIDSFGGDTVYLLIEAADESGGSVIEAAVDNVRITVEVE